MLSISACKISECDVRPLSDSDLEAYGRRLFCENVCAPLCLMDMVLAFDEYLLLSDEEKEDNWMFYNKIYILGDNLYSISNASEGYVQCIIDTHGTSLMADGAVWEVRDAYGRIYGSAHGLFMDYDFRGSYDIQRTGGGFELKYKEEEGYSPYALNVSLAIGDDDENTVVISSAGYERTDAYSCSFSVDSPMIAKKNTIRGEWFFDGTFRYTTCRVSDDKELDSCSFVFKPGYLAGFNANR